MSALLSKTALWPFSGFMTPDYQRNGMDRRRLLRLSGLILSSSLIGCVSEGESATSFSVTETGEIPVEKRTKGFADVYPDDKPSAEVVVGEKPENSDNPHGVRIFNEYGDSRDISLTVNAGSDSQTLVFEGEGAVSTDSYLALATWRPADYTTKLDVKSKTEQLQKTFDVPQSVWDGGAGEEEGGSSSQHNVYIRENEIEVNSVGAG